MASAETDDSRKSEILEKTLGSSYLRFTETKFLRLFYYRLPVVKEALQNTDVANQDTSVLDFDDGIKPWKFSK